MHLTREQRRIRDEAFLDSMYPERILRREIVQARLRKGMTQKQLAQRIRTSQSAIADLENGKHQPSISTLKKLATATGTRLVMHLANDSEPPL